MNSELLQVREFHSKIGESISSVPRVLDFEPEGDKELAQMLRQIVDSYGGRENTKTQLIRRALMAIEELAEWIEAHCDEDLIAAADAWGDRAYVLLGDAVAAGLPVDAIFDEVHRSNMTKVGINAISGKGIKSNGFMRPDFQKSSLNLDTTKET